VAYNRTMDLVDLAQHERDRLALLGLLEELQGILKRPARVIPWPNPLPEPLGIKQAQPKPVPTTIIPEASR
jgi:hypothetical protein